MNIIKWHNGPITAANTTKTGAGTVSFILTTTEDVYVDRVVFRALGSNVAAVVRLWVNDGKDNDDTQHNALIAELTLPATTLDEAAQFTEQKLTTDLWLPAKYRLFVTLGTTVASGYQVTAIGGRYQDLQSSQP